MYMYSISKKPVSIAIYHLPVPFHSRVRKMEWKQTNGSNCLPVYCF